MIFHCFRQYGLSPECLVYICPMRFIMVFSFYRESDRSREVQLKASQLSQEFMPEINWNGIFLIKHFGDSITSRMGESSGCEEMQASYPES